MAHGKPVNKNPLINSNPTHMEGIRRPSKKLDLEAPNRVKNMLESNPKKAKNNARISTNTTYPSFVTYISQYNVAA